jgi:hypothetical protein
MPQKQKNKMITKSITINKAFRIDANDDPSSVRSSRLDFRVSNRQGVSESVNNEQPEKTNQSRVEICEPFSKVTLESFVQSRKHHLEMVSIDEGIQIDSSDEQFSNADSPRVETLQKLSNVKTERFVQSRKQWSEMVSIDEGI